MKREELLRPLLVRATLAELGPGPRPGTLTLADLNACVDTAMPDLELSRGCADLVRALLLLWHDHLDAAHTLAQEIESRDGSYVHAIMHRREPDYGNAKYWFRRVGAHPCFASLGENGARILKDSGQLALAARLLPGGAWDPLAFVDACERAAEARSKTSEVGIQTLRQLQQAEFETLLAYLLAD